MKKRTPEEFARRLRRCRERLRLSQKAMAQRMGVSFVSVNRWEGGVRCKPSPMAWLALERVESSYVFRAYVAKA